MTILAIGEITIANIDDINISTDQPIDPVPDQLWLDTSTVPNVLSYCRQRERDLCAGGAGEG